MMTGRSKKQITVEKTVHLKNAIVKNMSYISSDKPILKEMVEAGEEADYVEMDFSVTKNLLRISEDNGRTWKTTDYAHWEEKRGDRIANRRYPVYHFDTNHAILIEFVTESESWASKEDGSFGPYNRDYLPFRTARIFYRFSTDEGASWGPTRQLIQKGACYNEIHWADGIYYDKNMGTFEGLMRAVQLRDGSLVLPIGLTLLGEDGELIKWPDRFGEEIWAVMGCATLKGRWNEGLSDIEWEISNHVTVPEYMSRSLCEPAVAELDDGKLMMIMRGNATAWQTMPGVKFYCISKDGGRTWGPAVPLTYPNGDFVYSPGSYPNLFCSSKNGKVYMIANILPTPPRQSDPRYPLKIVEIDQTYFWALPETETVIQDREERHSDMIRFSNWQRIEDRETGNPVIFMTESLADSIIPKTEGTVIPDSYRYEIKLPD